MDKKEFLKVCLDEKEKLPMEGIKAWEFSIQEAVEKACPGKQWYEVTRVPIFTELISGKMPVDVCEMVWNDVAQELALKQVKNESLDKKIMKAEGKKSGGKENEVAEKER